MKYTDPTALPPWFWKLPFGQWPAYWLHYPPMWIWRLLALMPARLRWRLADWAVGLPGVCGVSIHSIGAAEYPESGLMANRCVRDEAPCWCGKYQTHCEWSGDMNAVPEDPLRGVKVTFS